MSPERRPHVRVEFEGDHMVLLEDVYDEVDGHPHRVPAGSHTDGASIPTWLMWMFPKINEKRIRAAVHHDHDYRTHRISRKDADRLFLARMLADGNDAIRSWIMYRALRWFGGIAWRKNGKKLGGHGDV